MALYIANPSYQTHIFHFREPVNNKRISITLNSGNQTEIGHGWTAAQQAEVIHQIERYGGRDAAEAHGAMGRFNGLLFRDRGVISESEILTAHEADVETRGQRSASEATKAALGFDRAARKGERGRPGARVTETTVIEEKAPYARARGDEVAFNLTVDPDNGRSDVKLPI